MCRARYIFSCIPLLCGTSRPPADRDALYKHIMLYEVIRGELSETHAALHVLLCPRNGFHRLIAAPDVSSAFVNMRPKEKPPYGLHADVSNSDVDYVEPQRRWRHATLARHVIGGLDLQRNGWVWNILKHSKI